jgi:ABC-type lipoprotein export system ATPase subunit
MSGGERQRVAIARALIFHPPLLLGDEPTGNLDSATGEEILGLLDDLQKEFNSTLLLVTHNELAASFCDRVVTLHDGQILNSVQNPVLTSTNTNTKKERGTPASAGTR